MVTVFFVIFSVLLALTPAVGCPAGVFSFDFPLFFRSVRPGGAGGAGGAFFLRFFES